MERPAAWHPDPSGAHDHRWWDGEQWTEHVADAGVSSVDPVSGNLPSPDPATGWVGGSGQQAGWQQQSPAGPQASGSFERQGPPGQQGSAGHSGASWQQGGHGPDGGWRQPSNTRDGMALAAMIVGILGLLISWIPLLGIMGGLAGIVALVLGIIARKKIRTNRTQGEGMAITGIVTGVLAVVIAVLMTAFFVVLSDDVRDATAVYTQCMNEIDDVDECTARMQQHIQDNLFRGNGSAVPSPTA